MGSGADVAAIAYGRPIRFQRTGQTSRVEIIEKPLPEHIPNLNLLWTGVSANTRELVPPFLEWAKKDSSKPVLEELIGLSDQIARKMFNSTVEDFYESFERYFNLLAQTLKSAQVDWTLPIHEELEEWTAEYQGQSKPTGAGGGDMALLIGDLPLERRSELIIPLDPFGSV
ncbi:MAG TPA: hypothetical protein ENH10_05910 [Bacteroidetes bacterium]|nr:hypothetical protein [Bacteroidota bacterium]HEX04679.1 hypothetical protein [Bacteroidota bacterium]